MPLESGTRLGNYEIDAPIGAGGMGEVYKAKDIRLDRIVAIKVLPEHLSTNAELKQRFEQEARAVSSLNHPNICTLYDVGHEDGVDFMVMEYIEGETLADRLTKGALPLDQAQAHAIAISEALGKAHREGVVHRDLKPGNIIITKSGPKLLDFGLAKMLTGPESRGELSSLATEAKPLTKEGTILGTFQYMAPEQLESKETDARTDIFAFGAVLYEMLTGRGAFHGESQASLITAIMSSEPPALTELVPLTPPALERLVRRCLAKDPDRRWQNAGDVALELESIRDRPEHVSSDIAARQGSWKERSAWILGAVLACAAVFLLTRPDPPRVARFATEVGRLSLSPGEFVRITPDGTTLVYVGERDGTKHAFKRSLDELEATPIAGTEGAQNLSLSPEGDKVAFLLEGALMFVPLEGGTRTALGEVDAGQRGHSWGEDGSLVYGTAADGLWRVPGVGLEPERLTEPAEGRAHVRPFHLPGEKGLVFTDWTSDDAWVAVLPAGSREPRRLVQGAGARVTSSGHLTFERGGSLWAVGFDLGRLDVDGSPVPVIQGVEMTGAGAAQYDIADNGTLVYVPASQVVLGVRMDWVGRDQTVTTLADDTMAQEVRIAPDGDRLAYRDASQSIWLFDIERRSRSLLVRATSTMVWSPDGSQIIFKSNADLAIRTIASDGSGDERVLHEFEGLNGNVFSSSADGRTLALVAENDIWLLPVDGQPSPLLETPAAERRPAFSPVGDYLAYTSDESGRREVQVQSLSGPRSKWVVSVDGGTYPVWSANGRELFYRSDGRLMVVDVRNEPTFNAAAPRVLFDTEALAAYREEFAVAPDGQRFVFIERLDIIQQMSLVVVLNWLEELKQLVPVDH